MRVLDRLGGCGRVVFIDGPTTEVSFAKLIARYPLPKWEALARKWGVDLDVIDLREHEWVTEHDIVVRRVELPGDSKGSTEVDLRGELSEFWGHAKSTRGYYRADYDRSETSAAHDGRRTLTAFPVPSWRRTSSLICRSSRHTGNPELPAV